MKKLDHILKFALDVLVLACVTLLAYFDKIPSEIVISVVSVYAGAVGARRAMTPPDGKGGAGGSAAMGMGIVAMLATSLWSLRSGHATDA